MQTVWMCGKCGQFLWQSREEIKTDNFARVGGCMVNLVLIIRKIILVYRDGKTREIDWTMCMLDFHEGKQIWLIFCLDTWSLKFRLLYHCLTPGKEKKVYFGFSRNERQKFNRVNLDPNITSFLENKINPIWNKNDRITPNFANKNMTMLDLYNEKGGNEIAALATWYISLVESVCKVEVRIKLCTWSSKQSFF